MTTLEPEQKDILEKLNQLVLEENWGTVDRVHTAECPNGIPKGVAVIMEAIEEIKRLRMRIINWRNDIEADEKVRKETAKDILQDWYNDLIGMGIDGYYVKQIAEKYGVEIDNE